MRLIAVRLIAAVYYLLPGISRAFCPHVRMDFCIRAWFKRLAAALPFFLNHLVPTRIVVTCRRLFIMFNWIRFAVTGVSAHFSHDIDIRWRRMYSNASAAIRTLIAVPSPAYFKGDIFDLIAYQFEKCKSCTKVAVAHHGVREVQCKVYLVTKHLLVRMHTRTWSAAVMCVIISKIILITELPTQWLNDSSMIIVSARS